MLLPEGLARDLSSQIGFVVQRVEIATANVPDQRFPTASRIVRNQTEVVILLALVPLLALVSLAVIVLPLHLRGFPLGIEPVLYALG